MEKTILASNTRLPLSQWELLHTGDPGQACDHLSTLFRPHRVITHAAGNSINFKHNRVEVGNFSMNAVSYGNEVTINAKDNADNYLIKFTLRGATDVIQNRHTFNTWSDSVCVLNPTLPLEDHLSADCDMLIVQFAGEQVRQVLAEELGNTLNKPFEFLPVCLPLTGSVASYAHMVMTICADFNREDSGLKSRFVRNQIEQLLLSLLLVELPHTYSDLLNRSMELPSPSFMRRVDEYIDAHLSGSISCKDLAIVAGTSVRSLQKAFCSHEGISPILYLRNRRLQHARSILLNGNKKSDRVTEAALSSGFTHMGRFAHYYRERFGELPSATGKDYYLMH